MKRTKAELFDTPDIRLATFAKALSHPARIAIIRALAERNTCVCGELVEILPLAQATVSQHLKELKEAGIISGSIDGPKVCYCLNPEIVTELFRLMNTFIGIIQDCSCMSQSIPSEEDPQTNSFCGG